jgi:RimJ/RimL family protein N-acetyltransferase
LRTLRTSRLAALPLRPENFQEILLLFQDPQVTEYIGGVRDENFARRWLRWQLAQWRVDGFGTWVFRDPADNSFVGTCRFHRARQLGIDEMTAFGYLLRPQFWHMGLATEMARGTIRIDLARHSLGNVAALIHPRNTRSKRVATRLGFHFERSITWGSEPNMLYRLQC